MSIKCKIFEETNNKSMEEVSCDIDDFFQDRDVEFLSMSTYTEKVDQYEYTSIAILYNTKD